MHRHSSRRGFFEALFFTAVLVASSTIMEKINRQTAKNGVQMYNQFKRPSAGSVSELYYIYRNA